MNSEKIEPNNLQNTPVGTSLPSEKRQTCRALIRAVRGIDKSYWFRRRKTQSHDPSEDTATPRYRSLSVCATLSCYCLGALLLLFTGCATDPKPPTPSTRRFDFRQDTFAYANELAWEYFYDTNGVWTTRRREPQPSYSLHCVVVARSARQFFDYARFDRTQPAADESTYRRLVRHVIRIDPRRDPDTAEQIIIPGYASLREFS